MMSDTRTLRSACYGLTALLVQAMFVPTALAKQKQAVAETAAAPALASEATPTPAPAPASASTSAPASASAAAPAPPESQPQPSPGAETEVPAAPPEGEMAMPSADMFESSTLEVVKVTVDRREQDIQKYAGSASAFSGDDLERAGVESVKDVSTVAPSVEVGVQEGNTEVFIRGLGSNNNTELGDPSAATHIDGVYIPRPRGVGSMFFDLERVEINRGPQGTIRGRNALAGSLNIITAKPKLGEFASEASYQIGNYSQRVGRGMVNVPLGDRVALRLAGMGEVHDSFYTNGGANTAIKGAESGDVYAFRPSVKWAPTDAITVNVSADYTQEKGTGYSGSNFSRALSKGIMPSEVPDPRHVYYSGVQGFEDAKQWGVKGDLVIALGRANVQYLGGYRDLDYRQLISGASQVMYNGIYNDPPNSDDYSASHWHTRSKSQVHEIRIYAPDQDRFRWTVGGFFFREKQFAFLGNTADQSGGWRGVEFNMPDVKGQSEAGYIDGTFDISKIWRVLGGIRITHETKSRKGIGNIYGFGWPDGAGASRMGTPGFKWAEDGRPTYTGPGADPNAAYGMGINADPCTVFLQGIQQEGVRDNIASTYKANGCGGSGTLQPQNGSYGASFFDFRLGTDYDFAPGHMAYLSVSTGHASGGFNDNLIYTDSSGNRQSRLTTYKPEMVVATEVGTKNELFDRKVKANLSLFEYEYYDQVLQSVVQVQTDPNNDKAIAGFAVRDNIAHSRVLGAEIDGDLRLRFGFMVSVLGSFLYSRATSGEIFDGRVAYSPTGTATDKTPIKGKTLPRSPLATVNLILSQHLRTSAGWLDWMVSGQVRTKYYMTIFNGNGQDAQGNLVPRLQDYQPAYFRADASVGFTRPDGKARFEAFVTNLTNVAYMTSLISSPDVHIRYYNPPRQIGTRITMTW